VTPRLPAAAVEQGHQVQPEPTAVAQERTGVNGRKDQGQTLSGPDVDVGAPAPPFRLVDSNGMPVNSADFRGKLVVLSVVPSIETPVCEAQTARMAAAPSPIESSLRTSPPSPTTMHFSLPWRAWAAHQGEASAAPRVIVISASAPTWTRR